LSYPRFTRATQTLRATAVSAVVVLAALLTVAASASAATTTTAKSASSSSGSGSGGAGLGSTSTSSPATKRSTRKKKRTKKASLKSTKKATSALPGDSRHLGDRIVRPGMTGHDIRVLQAYLTLAGYPTSVDGDYGPATKTSVVAFQNDNGFTPNGIVTIPVEKKLRAKVAAIEADPPATNARINADGTATAPAGAPTVVQEVIAAANRIIHKPYVYGGGHGSWNDSGYDCSGAVSFALHGANLLSSPEDSSSLESYGSPGPGHWITIYANSGHAWIVVAGRAFDTADFGGPNIPAGSGPRWRTNPTGNLNDGTGRYIVRHPAGL
jgi:peptidoglycan hydrolase-like protein with peptidoglycan-binding domain